MKIEITDGLVAASARAAFEVLWGAGSFDRPETSEFDRDRYKIQARAALEAVATIIADQVLERATDKLKNMSFLLSIGSPEEGPFTRQDRVRGEVIEQACDAIRALKEPTP